LRATVRPARAAAYGRPGGPWSGPRLDSVVSGVRELVGDGLRLPAAEIERRVGALAGGLRRAGVRRRQVVAWQLPNGIDAFLLYRACWRIGAVAMPIHHQAGTADVDVRRRAVDVGLFVEPGRAARLVDDGSSAPVTATASPARPSDVAAVLFTSGSAGPPKAVLHTQRALAYKARLMRGVHGLRPDDAVLMPAPLAHISGLLNGVLVPGAAGMKSVLMAKWEPADALRIVADDRISFMIGPPAFFVSMRDAAGYAPGRVRSMKLISSGGAGITPAFVDMASEAFGCRVKRTYGSTEAPTVTTSYAGDDPARGRDYDGRATGEVELKVDGTGELLVRGPELFVGYADERHNAAAFDRGWFRTGDAATIEDGWVRIAGRLDDVIIRGGENIAAAEVESVLEAHPAVRQAVALGYPDVRLGERVAAVVVLTPGSPASAFDVAACRAWFAARGITTFKTPERVEVVDALPLLPTGKPDRAALRRSLGLG
jgi:cyclohexanecarboxylate-CoA ligase